MFDGYGGFIAMILYCITYLLLSCGTFPTEESFTLLYFHCASMTTNQQHSKKLIPQFESELKSVLNETTFDACKAFVKPIGDRWIDHCSTRCNETANPARLKLKPGHLEIPAALPWQPPQMPPCSPNPRVQHQNTGCSVVSADFLMPSKSELEFNSNLTTGCHHRTAALSKAQSSHLANRCRKPQTSEGQLLLRCDHLPNKMALTS